MFGRADIKGLACEFVNLGFNGTLFIGKFGGKFRQHMAINLNTFKFHLAQHGNQRTLQGFINRHLVHLEQFGFEQHPQAQSYISIFGGIGSGLVDRHAVKGDGRLAAACNFFKGNRLMT